LFDFFVLARDFGCGGLRFGSFALLGDCRRSVGLQGRFRHPARFRRNVLSARCRGRLLPPRGILELARQHAEAQIDAPS
jgi:hypothetical protein